MGKREPGIDLLRCVGLLFVTGFHFFLFNGFYHTPQTGWAMLAADSARWLFFSCNGIFMTLTGYLKSVQPLSRRYYRCLVPVLLGYSLASAISIPVRHLIFGDVQTIDVWITRFFSFGGCYYGWYVEMYVGLLLLSPIFNLAMERLHSSRQLLWLAGTMVAVTALPSITELSLVPDYWTALYPLTYYVLGAIIRRLSIKIRPWQGLSVAAFTAIGLGIVTLSSSNGTISESYGQSFGGFWITLIVLCVFLSLYHLSIGRRFTQVLAWASGGCFEGYLLSHLLDGWIYQAVPAWRSPEQYPAAFFCLTIPIFLCSIVMGKALHTLVQALTKRLAPSIKIT